MLTCDFQALFAGSIPEIIDIVKTFPKYNGTYLSDRGRRHVLLFRVSFSYSFVHPNHYSDVELASLYPILFSVSLASILEQFVIKREMFRLQINLCETSCHLNGLLLISTGMNIFWKYRVSKSWRWCFFHIDTELDKNNKVFWKLFSGH